MEEANKFDRFWKERGIFIDIFPIFRQPMWIHLLSEKMHKHVYSLMCSVDNDKEMWKIRLITRLNEKIFFPILRIFCLLFKGVVTSDLGIPFHSPRPLEKILPLTEATFEGHSFPVPKDCHTILTLMFGDYMRLPDMDNLPLHTGKLEIYDE